MIPVTECKGWKLVPIEPTPEMLNAGAKFSLTLADAYKEMVNAAPKPEGMGIATFTERKRPPLDFDGPSEVRE